MNARTKVLLALLSMVVALTVAGCVGGGPGIGIVLTPSGAQSAVAGQVVHVTATVSNDPKAGGVSWSLSGAGALSAQTSTSVTYTAPSPIPANATATITATSVSDPTKSMPLTINLQAVSISLTPSTAQTDEQGQTTSVTAVVSNDPANKGVTWSLSGAGALSGQTATAVTYTAPATITTASTATITATSVFDGTKTSPLTVNLVPPPTVTTTVLPSGTVSAAYATTTLAAAGGVSPYTWSVTAGALPAGLTLSSAGAISGTPTTYGTSNFTVQVKDAKNVTGTAGLSIKINPAPLSVTTSSLPNAVANSAYPATSLAATGGVTPYTWSVTVGALPAGLTLSSAGQITGTATTAGTSNFTVQVKDSLGTTAPANLSITILPVLSITTSSLSNGITSTAYSATLAATGGVAPITWSVTVGALPAGLTLNPSTGAITGTPTTAGTSSFTVQAADSGNPQQKIPKPLSITIVQQLTVTTASLPAGAVTSTYSATLTSSGGTPAMTWSVTVGALPAGLTLNAATGAITGTPAGPSGTANFTVQAADSGTPQQTAPKPLSITINPVLSVTTTSPMPTGTTGAAYSQTLQTNGGGIPPISWSITSGSLPNGLGLNASTGAITGTPTVAGTFNFTAQAADSGTPQQKAPQALSISVSAGPLVVTPATLPLGAINEVYQSTNLAATGGVAPYTWSVVLPGIGPLPSGLTLSSSGQITGTPTASGSFNFTAQVKDSVNTTATGNFSITVNPVLAVTTASLPAGTVGTAYSAPNLTASGGITPYSWSVTGGALPGGLSLSSGGQISGQPTTSGTFSFTVQVADSGSGTAPANLSIVINPAPPLSVTTTSGSLPSGTLNTVYPSTNLNASGGIQPYSWTLVLPGTGPLPPGLSLSSGGQITGTPTTAGTYPFTVQVTDSATPTANTAPANLSITVNAAPTCVAMGGESLLNGQYAFVLKGFDNGTGAGETMPEPVLIGGVLTVDGTGHITTGTIDINNYSTKGVMTNAVTTGSYGVSSTDHRGCMMITTAAGTQNYRFSLGNISGGVASTGHMIDFDSTGPFTTGVLRKQNSAAFGTGASQVTGNYTFGASSVQNSASCNGGGGCGGSFAAVGVFYFATGSVTGGEVDFNNNGNLDGSATNSNWPLSPGSISSGSYTVSSTNGRGTLVFTPSGSSAVTAILYVVSSTDVLVLNSDDQTNNSLFAGEMLQQSGAPFSNGSLSGNYVAYTAGFGSTATDRENLLLVNANNVTDTFTATILQNHGGIFKSQTGSGSYSVASSGRTLLTVTGNTTNPTLVLYLVNGTEAFLLDDNAGSDAGFMQAQTGGPFSNSSANGKYAYGGIDPQSPNSGVNSGVATFTSATASLSVTEDSNSGGSLTVGGTQSFTYSIDSTGLIHLPSGCAISSNSTTCQSVLYMISPAKAVLLDTTSKTPKLQVADQ